MKEEGELGERGKGDDNPLEVSLPDLINHDALFLHALLLHLPHLVPQCDCFVSQLFGGRRIPRRILILPHLYKRRAAAGCRRRFLLAHSPFCSVEERESLLCDGLLKLVARLVQSRHVLVGLLQASLETLSLLLFCIVELQGTTRASSGVCSLTKFSSLGDASSHGWWRSRRIRTLLRLVELCIQFEMENLRAIRRSVPEPGDVGDRRSAQHITVGMSFLAGAHSQEPPHHIYL